jgi:SRSO17 transposase
MAAVRERLRSYQARYAPFFGRRELRGRARAYLQGLLSDEPRKSIERMVLRRRRANANAVRTQQLFLRQARWDDAPILAAHRELVAATLGEAEGVLAVDGTDRPKDGTESVRVARPYCGQLGKQANCQAAVFVAYLGRGSAALVDRRLSPETQTGVAEGALPVRWVTCDEDFSISHAFLDGVAALGLGYLADVARNTHVWTVRPGTGGSPSKEVGDVADALPADAWRPFVLREGSKGPQAILCAVLRVVARRGLDPGPDVWLLLRRNPATDELKCYLSHGPADMPAEQLVWPAGLRGPIEQCFRDGKQLFGLGDYEGRSWQGWHRHATLVMLAHFFVVRETLRLQKNDLA